MQKKSLILIVAALALTTLACRVSFNLPEIRLETGPTRTEDIQVAVPEGRAQVRLDFGAGELNLSRGAEGLLIGGTARYNIDDLQPEVRVTGSSVRIQTGDLEIGGLPNIGRDFINEWNLELGTAPMDLEINAGAYQGRYDLGGLSLESLDIRDGAANVELVFSAPNLVVMSRLTYETGASDVELSGLANANFSTMNFRSGAGDYTLDFSGELNRDASVTVESGISQIQIILPEGMNARLVFEGGLSNVDTSGDWQRDGSAYTHPGSGPMLNIDVNMSAGNLELRTR